MTSPDELIAAVTGGALPRHRWIEAGALRLHCLEWGDAAAPPILLVHGNGGNAHWWDPLVPFLAPGWRLVAPDLRGHGESEWPAEPAYGIADCSGDLAALLDQLALDRVAVIAHSMGARIAVWLAAHHPARVRGLALLDTTLAGVDEAVAAPVARANDRPAPGPFVRESRRGARRLPLRAARAGRGGGDRG